MMIYALVHYPKLDTRLIDQLRQKYDPQFGLIDPHITVMFPVRDSIDGNNLVSHLENVLTDCSPFPIRIQGLQRSWELSIADGVSASGATTCRETQIQISEGVTNDDLN